MKKIFTLILAIMMVFSLVACANNETPDSTNNSSTNTTDGTNDTTLPTNGEIPELSNVETIMLDAVGQMQMSYPVMTWAIDITNAEQIQYYFDVNDFSHLKAMAMTETAYEFDPTLIKNVFSAVLVQVDDAAYASEIAERIKGGFKLDRWNVTAENVDIVSSIVNDYVVIVVMSKDDATYSANDVMNALVGSVNGSPVIDNSNSTPNEDTENTAPSGSDSTESTDPTEKNTESN